MNTDLPTMREFAGLIVIDEEGKELTPIQRDILMHFMTEHKELANSISFHVGPIHDGDIFGEVQIEARINDLKMLEPILNPLCEIKPLPERPFYQQEQWRRKNRWRR